MRFEQSFGMGRVGERDVEAVLHRLGWVIIPHTNHTHNTALRAAPSIIDGDEAVALPDLQVYRMGGRDAAFVEVKTKSRAGFHRGNGRYEHGIDKRAWDQYVAVAKATGCVTHIVVRELHPPAGRDGATNGPMLLYAPIRELALCGRHEPNWPDVARARLSGGGWVWPRNRMRGLDRFQLTLPGVGDL